MTIGLFILAGAAITAGGAYAASENSADGAVEAANISTSAAGRAADEARFRPYAVANSLGSTSVTSREQAEWAQRRLRILEEEHSRFPQSSTTRNTGPNGATLTPNNYRTTLNGVEGFTDPTTGQFHALNEGVRTQVDGRLAAANQSALTANQNATTRYATAASQDPTILGRELYQQAQTAIAPQRALEDDKFMAYLNSTGSVGHGVRDGGFDAHTGQSLDSAYNPLASGFARGRAEADYGLYNNSINQAMSRVDQYLAQAQGAAGLVGTQSSLENQPLEISAALGGRSAAAGGSAAQYIMAGGQAQAASASSRANNNAGLITGLTSNPALQRAVQGYFTQQPTVDATPVISGNSAYNDVTSAVPDSASYFNPWSV